MRGHLITLLAVALPAVVAVAPVAGASSPAAPEARVDFTLADVRLEPVGAYEAPRIAGCRTPAAVGEPALPAKIVWFVIPSDMTVDRVSVSFEAEERVPGFHSVAPVQPQVPAGKPAPAWVAADPSVYGAAGVYPPQRAAFMGDGYLAGCRIASVAVYPLRYEPRTGTLTLARGMSVAVSLKPAVDRSLPRLRTTPNASRLHERALQSLVENPAAAADPRSLAPSDGGEPPALGFRPRYAPSLEGSAVEYVIITSEELEPYFETLAAWRTKMGLPAVVRTVSWIEANYPGGCDTAERIRMFIRDAYATWGTAYVLLGGDTSVVPTRYCFTAYYEPTLIPCDAYYSSLDGTWNADHDHIFGEADDGGPSPGDSVDFYAEVYVGRAPVSNIVEAATFLEKTFAYEKTPAPVMTDRNLYLADMLFPYDWDGGPYGFDGAADVIEASMDSVPGGIHGARLYTNWTPFQGAQPLSAPASIDSMERGYNLVAHVGHGDTDIMRANVNSYITMSDVDGLTNGVTKAGFWWLANCTTAAIDFDCLAERAMNNPNGGASALFGFTRWDFPAVTCLFYWDWLGVLYGGHADRAGAVCALSKDRHATPAESGDESASRWTQFAMVYLGDPALPLWTGRPETLTVTCPAAVEVGSPGMTLTVTDPAPVDGALVCVAKSGDVYAAGETGPTGEVTLAFVPHTTGTLTVTVTAAGHVPCETTVAVTPAQGAHVHLESWAVGDDGTGQSAGNGNGRIESGETVELHVTVGNSGAAEAGAVTATLATSDTLATVQDGSADFGTIEAGSATTFERAFRFAVSPDCPNGHDIRFSLELADGGRGLVWTEPLVCRVLRPRLGQIYLGISEVVGDEDGVVEAGEVIFLGTTVLNDGNGDAKTVTGRLRYPPGQVSISDSTESWGNIPAGTAQPGSGGFRFTVDSAMTHRMRLVLTDAYGSVWRSFLDLTAPAATDSLRGKVQGTAITLMWDPVTDADLRGYDVYRSLSPGGPYLKANRALVEGSACFVNQGLSENTPYHFYVVAVDSSGNVGPHSQVLSVTTNPQSQGGWPRATEGGIHASPAVADIDGDGDLEIVVSSDEIYAWHGGGTEVRDGDGDPRTSGVFADEGEGGHRASVAIGEVDGDVGTEIVGAAWANVGTPQSPAYEVFVWNGEDGSVLPGWPVTTRSLCWASPALADLDRDGRAEVLIPAADGHLYCWRYNGSEWMDGDSNPLTVGNFRWLGAMWVYGSPAVADIDEDRDLEIIQPGGDGMIYAFNPDGSAVPGWPFDCEARSCSSPAVGDVDDDGRLEIAVASNAGKQWLLEANGTVMSGWPKTLYIAGDFPPSPVLANVNADPYLEWVQVSSDGRVNVRNYLGSTLSGWPQLMGGTCGSSPIVADIDGDAGMEIVVGCDDGKVYGYDTNGAMLPGWPIQTDAPVRGSPAVSDLDGDGDVEVVVGSMDANVYVWDCAGLYEGGERVEWGCFLHDPWRSQCYSFVVPVGVDDGDEGVTPLPGGPVLSQNSPNPFNPVTTIAFDVPAVEDGAVVRLTVHSVDGSLVRTLVDEPLGAGRHSAVWDGRDDRGVRSASGVYFCRLEVGETARVRKMTLLK